jgi:uncharacterized protein
MGMQREIRDFLCECKVATICYVKDGLPYCFNCLYAVIPEIDCIVFKSSKSSLHSRMHSGTPVAGTIYQASKSGYDNTGIQLSGRLAVASEMADIYEAAEKAYYRRFPIALTIPGKLFSIMLSTIKYTQTRNGIRHKLEWEGLELDVIR